MQENFTVGWGTLALINAAIAQSKNRRGSTWLIVSLFLGPVATAILVLLPKFEATPESIEREQASERVLKVINIALVVLVLVAIAIALVKKFWV